MQRNVFLFLSCLLLSACGRVSPTPDTAQNSYSHSLSVSISPADSPAEVAARYGGEIVVWQAEAGFAILGVNPGLASLSDDEGLEPNVGAAWAPEFGADGWTAWSSGWTAWSSGWTAWSSGWTAWSSGAGGSLTPTENHPVWAQLGLFEAQAQATNLGAGVIVAVIDTGIDLEHPIFAGHLSAPNTWYDFIAGDTLPQEVGEGQRAYGHGTAVAGVVRQVAPNAQIMPLRVLGANGTGDVTAVVAAINHAVAHGAHIINLSLGTARHSPALQHMIDYAASQGVYVVSAAGNTGNQRVLYPAANSQRPGVSGAFAVGVGSVDLQDKMSAFSAYGNRLELLAPGENLYTSAPDARLATWNGTSVAAPIVTGALALALAETTAPATLGAMLNATAQDISAQNPGMNNRLGWGRLSISAFLANLP